MSLHSIFLSYWPARALMTGVELGIFDQLARAPQTAEQVALSLRLNPDATKRLLQAFAAMGLLEQHGRAYRNAPTVSAQLVTGSPGYIGGIARHHAQNLWPVWSHLPTAVREGRPVLREAFGGESDPFAMLAQNTEGLATFLAGMEAGAKGFGEALAAAHDFSRHRHVIDVGGGTGVVAGPVAQHNPHLRVTLFDMPQVCALTGPLLFRFGCGPRLCTHGGDFFRAETFPTGADAAILARVLHDWGDADAATILSNCYRVMQPGGTVLVMEHLMDAPDPVSRAFTALSDLTMLVLTNGGRERTGAEYEALLQGVGFRSVTTHRLGGALAVIKGNKV